MYCITVQALVVLVLQVKVLQAVMVFKHQAHIQQGVAEGHLPLVRRVNLALAVTVATELHLRLQVQLLKLHLTI